MHELISTVFIFPLSSLASAWREIQEPSAEMLSDRALPLTRSPTPSPTIHVAYSPFINTHDPFPPPAPSHPRLPMSCSHFALDEDMYPGSDADTASLMSFEPFSGLSASSATDIQDHASISSGASVFSMSSSIRTQSFKHEYGRGLNNYSDVYQLPADGEELDRLGQ